MKRHIYILSAATCLILLFMASSAFAQQRATGPRPAPEPTPLFFREAWKETVEVPVTQAYLSNPDLELKLYGPGAKDIQITAEGSAPHLWTGLCAQMCGVALRHKTNNVDLTGKAKIRWLVKTSGFREIRPMLKLADGTWLVGDHADAYTFDFHESEFFLADVHWLKLDVDKIYTRGNLLDKVDLSKVEEIGFTDLTPGAGHGNGGWSDVAWIEVYGKAVKRDAAAQSSATKP